MSSFKKKHKLALPPEATPDAYELKCGALLSKYFNSNIEFIPTGRSTSPDIYVTRLHQLWEIKNIKGNGKHTIQHNLAKAKNQAPRIAISLLRSKMPPHAAVGRIKRELQKPNSIKAVILITKSGKIIDIYP